MAVVSEPAVTIEGVTAMEEAAAPGLRDYLAVINRRKLVIALTVLVMLVGAVLATLLQDKVYRATAEVLLQPRTSERIFSLEAGREVNQDDVATEIKVMESRSIVEVVEEALGEENPRVDIQVSGQTNVVEIRAEDVDPEKAATVANTYATTYIEVRRQQIIDDLVAAGTEVQARVADVDRQLAALGPTSGAEDSSRDPVRGGLEAQRATLTQQAGQLQLTASLTETGGAQLVSEAQVPERPVRPTPLRNGVLALMVGLILGLALAFLREHFDDAIRTKEDLDRVTRGSLNVLGLIPEVSDWRKKQSTQLISVSHPGSSAAEAYRTLRTSIQFLSLSRELEVLQITSPNGAEGKTTTTANLAVAMAQVGKRVIVVCCDLRRPRIHDFFGQSNAIGLTSVLLGQQSLDQAVQSIEGLPRLKLLASGPPPPNPAELLASREAARLVDLLRSQADVVLLDTPPVLPVTDSLVVSNLADGTVLVVSAYETSMRDTTRAVELLTQVGAPLVGAVLNGARADSTYGYYYGRYPSRSRRDHLDPTAPPVPDRPFQAASATPSQIEPD